MEAEFKEFYLRALEALERDNVHMDDLLVVWAAKKLIKYGVIKDEKVIREIDGGAESST